MLRTLGIETSCDETAVAVLDGDGRIEANLLSSQIAAHAPFGGVVPELASREHLRALPVLVERALETITGPMELVAVTTGPGLVGALLVGVRFAAAFAWGSALPLAAVDHLEGHLVSPFLDLDGLAARPEPDRVLALVASGGHSSWYLMEEGGRRRLGRTRDDAAGESFDKVAQVLGSGLPRWAGARSPGPRRAIRAAVHVASSPVEGCPPRLLILGAQVGGHPLDPGSRTGGCRRGLAAAVADFAASFETAVVDQLTGASRRAGETSRSADGDRRRRSRGQHALAAPARSRGARSTA